MKYIFSVTLLLSSLLLWTLPLAVSAQDAGEPAMPVNAEEYASVAWIASAANIRSEASLASEVLRAVPPGYPLAILERAGDWVLVADFLARKGWIYSTLLNEPGTVIIKVWKGNLRSGPGLNGKIIMKLDHGAILAVSGTKGDWLQVSDSAGVSGWLHRDVVWPHLMEVSARKDVAAGPRPVQEVKLPARTAQEIKLQMAKRETAETVIPAAAEQAPAPSATQEQPPEAPEAEEYTSTARIENKADSETEPSLAPAVLPTPSSGRVHEFKGSISVEGRLFAADPLYPDQERHNGSIAIAPEYYLEWPSGSNFLFSFSPFLRIDSADSERTHFDIRELNFLLLGDSWELRLGIGKVFWGVTEFVHLVDIINQTDLVESIKGEDKLGQPMVHLSVPADWGVLDFFVLPYFRERTFPGADGRLRPALVVDTDNPVFESGSEENHIDLAVRYSHFFDFFDFGIYYFKGTGREPIFIPGVNASNESVLVPYYRQIDQAGTDLQLVAGSWLWKLEALYQDNEEDHFFSTTGGFEYTFVGLGSSKADLGIIIEYAYDDRDDKATTSFANDLFLGLRLGVNDAASTEILLGISYDLDNRGNVLQLEGSRRLTDSISLEFESWAFFNTEPGDYYLHSIRDDDFVRLQLLYYF